MENEGQRLGFIKRNIDGVRVFTFELIGMALFAYGIICSRGSDGLLSLAFLGSIAFAGPFSGGHVNPAVTLAFFLTGQITILQSVIYWVGQLLGALLGAFLCFMILGQINSPMITNQSFYWIVADTCGEALGTFTFVTFILIQCNPRSTFTPNSKPLTTLILIAVALHFSRMYTFHSGGCLNPGMAISLETFQVFKTGEKQRFQTMWVFILGPFAGSAFAAFFYKAIYIPILETVQKK